jgi:hypothetical protein
MSTFGAFTGQIRSWAPPRARRYQNAGPPNIVGVIPTLDPGPGPGLSNNLGHDYPRQRNVSSASSLAIIRHQSQGQGPMKTSCSSQAESARTRDQKTPGTQ